MGVWFRRNQRGERRSFPTTPLSDFVWPGSGGYQSVDVTTGETSLQVVAYRSGVDLLASLVSELPFGVYRDTGALARPVPVPGNLEDPSGEGQGIQDWAYMVMVSWLLRGNLYGDMIDVSPTGMLRQVDLFHPDAVQVWLEDGAPRWTVRGKPVPASRMLHRRVNPVPGHLLGLSPIHSHASTLGLSLTATRYALGWFQSGGHPSGILTSDSELDQDQAKTAKQRFLAALYDTHEPVVLGRGWKFEQIQVAPEESQFLEAQGYTSAECARILGPGIAEVLGYASGGSMTYANVVDRDLALLKYTASKWLRRMERLLSAFLPRPRNVVFDRDAFLETNALERWRKHRLGLTTGAVTINEVREEEHRTPVPWGDVPWVGAKQATTAEGGSGQPEPGQQAGEQE